MAFQRRHSGGSPTIGQLQRDLADYCQNRMEGRSLDERLCDFSALMGTTLSYCRDYKDHMYTVTYEIGSLRATVRGPDELYCVDRCKTEILYKLKVFSMNGEDGFAPPPSTFALVPLTTSSLPAERSVDKSREAKRDETNRLAQLLLAYCKGIENARNPTRSITYPKTGSDRTAAADDLSSVNGEHRETEPVENDDRNRKIEPSEPSSDHVGENDSTEKVVKLEPIELQQASSDETETDTFSEQNCEQLIPSAAAAPKLDSSDGIVESNFASDKIMCEKNAGCHYESLTNKSESVAEGTENHAVSAPPSIVLQDDKDAMAATGTENVTVSVLSFSLREETDGPATEETEDSIVFTSPPSQDDDKDRTENAEIDLPETEVDKGNEEDNDIERESAVIGDTARKCETNADNGDARYDGNDASSNEVQDPTDQAADLATETSRSPQPETAELFEEFIDDLSRLLNNLTVDNISNTADTLLAMLVAANDTHESYTKLIADTIVYMVVDDVAGNCVLYASLCSKIYVDASNSERPGVRNVVPAAFKHQLMDSCFSSLWGAKHDELADGNRPESPEEPSAVRRVQFDLESRMRSLAVCRFLGELFLLDDLKVYFQVSRTVQKLMRSCDVRCLECLCVLLTIVGPKLKNIVKTKKTHYSMKEIYAKLERCATPGRSDESLPKRTVSMLDDLLRLKNNDWALEDRERPCPTETGTVLPFAEEDRAQGPL